MASIRTITGGNTHPDGVLVADAATEKVGFHGADPSSQRAGAAQAAAPAGAVAAAAGEAPTKAEFDAAVAQVNALTALTNEMRAALVEKGLIKGAA